MRRIQNVIVSRIFRRVFWTSTLIAFTLLGAGFVDTTVISRFLGLEAVAAAGLAYPFYTLVGIIYGCISTGFKSIASRNLSQGDTEGYRRISNVSITFALLVSLAVTALLLVFAGPLAYAFGARGNSAGLLDLTRSYLRGLSIGFPPLVLNYVLSTALQFDNGSRGIRMSNIVGMAVDIALDIAVIVFGRDLNLAVKMFLISMASSVSAYVTLAILCVSAWRNSSFQYRFTLPKRSEIKEILSLGSDKLLSKLLNFVRPMIINPLIISLGGTPAMAALSVRNNLMSFVAIPGYGIGDAVSVTADISYNLRSRNDLYETGRLAHRYSLNFELVTGILICLFSRPLASFFLPGADPQELSLLIFALCMGGAKLLLETLLSARESYLQAIGRLRDAKRLLYMMSFISVILSVALFGWLFGDYGVMAALTVADLLTMAAVYLSCARWKKNLRPTPEDYLIVADACDVDPQNVIELSVSTPRECALTAEQVQLFCRGHGAGEKASYRAGICAEEALTLLLSILEPGSTGTGSGGVNFHMTYSDGKARMHFRACIRGTRLGDAIERMKSSGISRSEDGTDAGETLLGTFASEISSFRSLDVENLILIV